MKKRAAIYVRISSDREGRELGTERQESDCREVAKRENLIVKSVFKDNDIGASTRSRKSRTQYIQLLNEARSGSIDAIIAYTSSRLTRRPKEHEDLIELAENYGIKFYYVASPSFDLNTSAGRMIARILAASDAAEAEDIAERVSRAKLQRAEAGAYLGGYRAYGYEGAYKDSEGNIVNRGRINIALVPSELSVYREAVERLIANERCTTIIRDFNKRGIPSPDGKQWTIGNFKRTITRKRYIIFDPHLEFDPTNPEQSHGTLEHKDQEYEASWPGLISRSEYELMMSRLNERAQIWAHGLVAGRSYLLTGLVICGSCGRPMSGSRRMLKDGTYPRRYRCPKFDNHGNVVGCGKIYRRAEPVDLYVTESFLDRIDTPEVSKGLALSQAKHLSSEGITKLATLQAHRRQLVAEYGQGLHLLSDYKHMLNACDSDIEALQREIKADTKQATISSLPSVSAIRDVWESATLDWQREVIQLLIEKVIINPGHPGTHMYNGFRFRPETVEIVWRDIETTEIITNLCIMLKATKRRVGLAC